MREMAMYYRMRGDLTRMKPYMEAALAQNPLDLDMARLYLDHRTGLVWVMKNQAVDLRTPRKREETRSDGVYEVTTYPSAADLARADELERQAKEVQRDAIQPLQRLAGALKDDPSRPTTPAKEAKWRLATGVYFQWIDELEKAGGTAAAGLRYDPTDLDSSRLRGRFAARHANAREARRIQSDSRPLGRRRQHGDDPRRCAPWAAALKVSALPGSRASYYSRAGGWKRRQPRRRSCE